MQHINSASDICTFLPICTYQALQIVWFGMIIRVATRVATGKGGASDVRSDAEDRQVSFRPDAIISN